MGIYRNRLISLAASVALVAASTGAAHSQSAAGFFPSGALAGLGSVVSTSQTPSIPDFAACKTVVLNANTIDLKVPVSTTLQANGGCYIVTAEGTSDTITVTSPDTITYGSTTSGAGGNQPLTQGGIYVVLTDGNGHVYSNTAGSSGAVSSVSNSDSTLTISPTTGAVVGSINLAHANTWTAEQITNVAVSGELGLWENGATKILRVDSTVGVILDNTSIYLNNNSAGVSMRGGGTIFQSDASGEVDVTNGSTHTYSFTNFGIYPQETIPTVTGTGSPTIASGSTDMAGEVTAGASATSIVIHSADAAVTTAPFCVVSDQGPSLTSFTYTITVSASHWLISVTQTSNSGNKIDYHCIKNGP